MRESLAAVNGAAVQWCLNVISVELVMHACWETRGREVWRKVLSWLQETECVC